MPDEKTQQSNTLLERLDKLPPQLKDAIFSDVNAEKMFDIGKRHGLLIDKLGEMTNETGLLMLGVTHPDEFVGNLAERLKVDRASASKIADDINHEIFAPVREHLRTQFGGTPQKEISEVRLPETGRLTSEISGQTQESTLEDLEAELERVLAEESSSSKLSKDKIEPLSVVKKPLLQDTYKGTDPYREQVEEDLPNVHPKAYSAPPASNKKEILEERLPETGRLTSEIFPTFGGQKTQPTPTPKPVEEGSPFSPLHEEKSQHIEPLGKDVKPPSIPAAKPHDIREPDGALPKFRGINMQSFLKEQGEPKTPEAPTPIEPIRELEKPPNVPQQKPPVPPILPPSPLQQKEEKDPYKETIE